MTRITEQPGPYRKLEEKTVAELTELINREDQKVALVIREALPQLNRLIEAIIEKLKNGGRLFYVGAGSGGRLSVLDAIELPTTYGVDPQMVQAILAGGVENLVLALEEKEDDAEAAWKMLQEKKVSRGDFVLGISASGTTPFVRGGLQDCRKEGIATGCLVSNPQSPIAALADYPVELITGPEFITGSTRMKCGTAQKMVFDMISTTVMIRLGRVQDNQMIDVKLINDKITDRAVRILMERSGFTDYEKAKKLLLEWGSVRNALESLNR
ncbi:MAG: hypothetical protein RL732_335 [Bacteroidota bacterium]|jgi:N-acetylmuramic acid 6-phosphate etherase